jgi:hypothetical protein
LKTAPLSFTTERICNKYDIGELTKIFRYTTLLVKIGRGGSMELKKTCIHDIKAHQGQEKASKTMVKFHTDVKETVTCISILQDLYTILLLTNFKNIPSRVMIKDINNNCRK